jgi:hypothetical protein
MELYMQHLVWDNEMLGKEDTVFPSIVLRRRKRSVV